MAVSTVKRAGTVKSRTRLVKPVIPGEVRARQAMTVMTDRRPITIAAVQVMAGVAHRAIRFQLIMGSHPMNPVGRCFAA